MIEFKQFQELHENQKRCNFTSYLATRPDTIHEFRDIMRMLGVTKAARLQLKNLVDDLVDEGKLVKLKGNRYSKAGETAQITGKLATHRDGVWFCHSRWRG